jgi:hypothetical protein
LHFAVTFLSYQPSAQNINALPAMTAWDFADTCNKSVPVYFRMQRGDDSRWPLFTIVLHNYIYHRWFRPYRSDIEDNRFICKFITPKELPVDNDLEPSPSPTVFNTLIAMNKAICAEADSPTPAVECTQSGWRQATRTQSTICGCAVSPSST